MPRPAANPGRKENMNILIACEESQRVCTKFRAKGHNAFSCDIIDCSGGHPEWHIKQDVLPLLNGQCTFYTADGNCHRIAGTWDMIIAHPPCTFLAVSGNRWFNVKKYGQEAVQRKKKREEAAEFFMTIAAAKCAKICIENPVGAMSRIWRKPDQVIQPYMFGDPVEKKTCLWLKGIPPLVPSNEVKPPQRIFFKSGRSMGKFFVETRNLPKEERARVRSKTFPGIATAMAEQWG